MKKVGFRRLVPCTWAEGPSRSGRRLQLLGEVPANPAEVLVKEIVGDRTSVDVEWLKRRISESLYRADVSRGGWIVDIAVWGPSVYGEEAAVVLSALRPEFARLESAKVPVSDA